MIGLQLGSQSTARLANAEEFRIEWIPIPSWNELDVSDL
jgi:hypothetical protein